MKNEMSSSGVGEDVIRAFVQMACAEIHLKTLYEKTLAELENGMVTDGKAQDEAIEKAENYLADLHIAADLRRRMMRKLFSMFEGGDKDVWCMVKHLGLSNMQMWEAWQGSEDDTDLLELAIESNKLFVSYITRFIGMEITDCAACLSDFLKGE